MRSTFMATTAAMAALAVTLAGYTPQVAAAARPSQQPSPSKDKDETSLAFPEQSIPAGARFYVAPMPNGFETYVIAGLHKKKVPVVVVTIREKADFEVTGVSETDKAGWAKMLFLGNSSTAETASIKIVNLKTSEAVFGYSVHKGNSARGKQSAGEAVAKHINEKIAQGAR